MQRTYVYDAWGVLRTSTGTLANSFRYTAREFSENNLMYYRARYYKPDMSRFISEDGISSKSTLNLYDYVANQPIKYLDPLGLVAINIDILEIKQKSGIGAPAQSGPQSMTLDFFCESCAANKGYQLSFILTVHVKIAYQDENKREDCIKHESEHFNDARNSALKFLNGASTLSALEKQIYADHNSCRLAGEKGRNYFFQNEARQKVLLT